VSSGTSYRRDFVEPKKNGNSSLACSVVVGGGGGGGGAGLLSAGMMKTEQTTIRFVMSKTIARIILTEEEPNEAKREYKMSHFLRKFNEK